MCLATRYQLGQFNHSQVVHKEDIKNSLTVFMKANKDKAEFQTGRRLKKHDGTYQKFSKCL
jgi:hypothetical protein